MKFYKLEHTFDPNITGTNNPTSQVNKFIGMTPEKKKEISNLSWENFPEKVKYLDKFLLKENANTTDFIDQTLINCGFIISPRVKAICERFKIVGHRFYPAMLRNYKRDRRYEYYLLYLIYSGHIINYPESQFSICEIYSGQKKYGNITLSSQTEHEKELFRIVKNRGDVLMSIFPEKLALNQKVDIFRFPRGKIYASQKTKDLFEAEGITGIKFIEAFEAEVKLE